MDQRARVMSALADRFASGSPRRRLRVGVDGPCGSGKSAFARDLVAAVVSRGRPAVHVDSDGFHHPRAIRYRQGRDSARGYYEDAYDFPALVRQVLVPLGPGGNGVYATQVHDMASDQPVTDRWASAATDAVVVFDCTFLQRGALRDHWDEVIYLQVPRDIALARAVARDADALGGVDSAREAHDRRYLAACDLYICEERPAERATILLDAEDLQRPRVLRGLEEPSA